MPIKPILFKCFEYNNDLLLSKTKKNKEKKDTIKEEKLIHVNLFMNITGLTTEKLRKKVI